MKYGDDIRGVWNAFKLRSIWNSEGGVYGVAARCSASWTFGDIL